MLIDYFYKFYAGFCKNMAAERALSPIARDFAPVARGFALCEAP